MAKRRANHEGTIFKDTRGYWIAEYVLPDGKKKRKASKRQSVVKEWLQTSLNDLKYGLLTVDDQITVSEFFDRFLGDVVDRTLKPKTIDSYRSLATLHILPALGKLKLKDVRPSHLQNLYSTKLDEGLSKRTVQYIHAVLRRAFNQAVKWEMLVKNPANAVTPPTPVKRAPETLSVDQIKQLFEVVKDHRYYPIYLIAVGCGLREGEILGLEARDVDLDRGQISVRQTVTDIRGHLSIGEPKTERAQRSVSAPVFVVEGLRGCLPPEGLIFKTSTGRPVSPRNLIRHFHSSLVKAGLSRVKFHSLRHSFASQRSTSPN